jgi:PQQ-like domain
MVAAGRVLAVQGPVYAQPLFVAGLIMAVDNQSHNVVFVATAQNNVYAFDADTFVALWPQPPLHLGDNDKSEILMNGNRTGCNNLSEANGQKEGIGTEATPVIDRKLGRMLSAIALGASIRTRPNKCLPRSTSAAESSSASPSP